MRRGLDPNRPTYGSKKGGLWPRRVFRGFGRSTWPTSQTSEDWLLCSLVYWFYNAFIPLTFGMQLCFMCESALEIVVRWWWRRWWWRRVASREHAATSDNGDAASAHAQRRSLVISTSAADYDATKVVQGHRTRRLIGAGAPSIMHWTLTEPLSWRPLVGLFVSTVSSRRRTAAAHRVHFVTQLRYNTMQSSNSDGQPALRRDTLPLSPKTPTRAEPRIYPVRIKI